MWNKFTKRFKVWLIAHCSVLIVFIAATIVVSSNKFLSNTINAVLGGERQSLSDSKEEYYRYRCDYSSKDEVLKAANDLNEEICEEGFVLLKNKDNFLPLSTSKKITVFGKNSTNIVLGGSGSNSGGSTGQDSKTIYSSLKDAGFTVNPVAQSFFENDSSKRPQCPSMGTILTGFPIGETPVSSYSSSLRDSYSSYNDLALVVLSRIGGEGFDLPRSMKWNGKNYEDWTCSSLIPGARSVNDHYLQLDQNETDMLKEACDHFDNVVVVINSASTLELGFLDDETHYAYSPNIKGAIWVGTPGNSGIGALGKILCGKVNPSGKTTDIYARDFKKDPTWNNFGNNLRGDGNRYTLGGVPKKAWCVEYEEGIYTGYRYYETRDIVEREKSNPNWYKENVVYPFGYGLSYTNFDWIVTQNNNATLNKDGTLTFDVKVKNNGALFDGKDVVELYYSAPYKPGEIEKSSIVLGDFAKTNLITKNGGEDTVTVKLNVRDMASYDYNDANNNGFKGYELDEGEYKVYISHDSHCINDSRSSVFTFTVPSGGFKYETDESTGTSIENLFNDVSDHITKYFSRNDFEGTWPTMMSDADLAITQDLVNKLNYKLNDKETDPWYTNNMPNQQSKKLSTDETEIKLYDLIGKDYNDTLWDKLLDELTVEQMSGLVRQGVYKTEDIVEISKPETIDADGPMGFAIFMGDPSIYDTCYYAGEVVVASTWNLELVEKMGEMVGNEGLIGNQKRDPSIPYSGWYAPAMNLHRSQFGGRNFEYYSEDGYLSGKMATAIVKGTQKKGVYTYCKHLVLNEQETCRSLTGLVTWANEQSMRENYFTPFEMVVKEGKTSAMMSSFNRIGPTWTGGSYNLLTKLLREEWGFEGMVITDFNVSTDYMNIDQMIRAGGDISLSADKKMKDTTSAVAVTCLRKATKNILYTVANSNAMEGIGEGVKLKYNLPYWKIGVICLDCALAVTFGFVIFIKIYKKKAFKKEIAE